MFGLEYLMALIKILVNIGFALITAIPLRIAWNCVSSNYFYDVLPERFLSIPYAHVVAFILVSVFVGEMIKNIFPVISKSETTVEKNSNN